MKEIVYCLALLNTGGTITVNESMCGYTHPICLEQQQIINKKTFGNPYICIPIPKKK